MTFLSGKNAPSHVAQADTPRPIRVFSASRPISLADAPVDTITACDWNSLKSVFNLNGRTEKSTSMICSKWIVVPKRSACFLKSSIMSGPMTPSG